ncbi:hypothetical protein D3C72_2077500 [compost metagenome]
MSSPLDWLKVLLQKDTSVGLCTECLSFHKTCESVQKNVLIRDGRPALLDSERRFHRTGSQWLFLGRLPPLRFRRALVSSG